MKMQLIEEAIKEYWGDRCKDYNEGCSICQVWKTWDNIKPKSKE